MPQIKLPSTLGETEPLTWAAFRMMERGLEFRTYTPLLTNVTTPQTLRAMYQLCGKACFVTIKLDYTGVSPTWSSTPYITLPIKVTSTLANLAEPPLSIVNITDRSFVNYALFDISHLGRISLAGSPAINKVYIISGFYWVD